MNATHSLANAAVTVTAIGLNSLWEDALVIACVWIFIRAFPRINAATRYLIWSAALVAAVVVPVATTMPFLTTSPPAAVTAAVKAPVSSVTRAFSAATKSAATSQRVHDVRPRTVLSKGSPAFALPGRLQFDLPLPFAFVVAALWALLAAASLARLGAGLLRLERFKRDALPLPVEYRSAMPHWNAAGKGARDVRLCVSDDIDVPVAIGLFDSMILIPRELLERLSPAEIDQIALHELAHLRRLDDWSNGFQRIVLALFGWNPSVRFAAAQLDLEREVACDDHVLSSSGVVRPYAMCLAKMAESSSWPRRTMAAPAVFATRKHISLRIERLLFAGRNAGTQTSIGFAAFAIGAVAALGVAIGCIAPSVAATSPALPANLGSTKASTLVGSAPQRIREIVRYVDVPRTVKVVAQATTHPLVAAHPTVTARPLVTAHPAVSAHPLVTPHPAVTPHPLFAMHPSNTNNISIHIPAIDVDITKNFASLKGSVVPKVALQTHGPGSCTDCDQSGADLRGRDLRNMHYSNVSFSNANLDDADLSGGSLVAVDFSHARLRGASFRNARLSGCDFSAADLSGADFTGAHVTACQFSRAQLLSAKIRSIVATCVGCDFSGSTIGAADLSNIHGSNIDFSGADLVHANLSGSTFVSVDFGGAHMNGANVDGASFTECDLSGTGLRRSDLARARLIDTDLPDDR